MLCLSPARFWSSRLSTNLRLLLDEAITDPLARLIRELSSAINVEYMRELPIRGATDHGVIEYARQESRIVVTTETGMNHKTFRVCTHAGIIVIAGKRRHESFQAQLFQRFLLSGRREEAKGAITFLTDREVRIKSHEGDDSFRLE